MFGEITARTAYFSGLSAQMSVIKPVTKTNYENFVIEFVKQNSKRIIFRSDILIMTATAVVTIVTAFQTFRSFISILVVISRPSPVDHNLPIQISIGIVITLFKTSSINLNVQM